MAFLAALRASCEVNVVFPLEPATGDAAAAEEAEVAAGFVEDINVPGVLRIFRQGISGLVESCTPRGEILDDERGQPRVIGVNEELRGANRWIGATAGEEIEVKRVGAAVEWVVGIAAALPF